MKCRSVEELISKGKSWGAVEGIPMKKDVEFKWNGQTVKSTVEIRGVEARVEDKGGKSKLRIEVRAVIDGVERENIFTFFRGSINEVRGYTHASADAPGGREEDAKRIVAVVKAVTGKEPTVERLKKGEVWIVCFRSYLEGFMRYRKVYETAEKWLRRSGAGAE